MAHKKKKINGGTNGKQNIFDEFKMIFESEKIFKISSQFMLNRFMSFTTEGFKAAIHCNKFVGKIPDSFLLAIYRNNIESRNAPYIGYAKKQKETEPELIKKICKIFCCNKKYAVQIIAIYRSKGIKIESMVGLKKGE